MDFSWIVGPVLGLFRTIRKHAQESHIAALHRRGHEIWGQLGTQAMHPHEAERIIVRWIVAVAEALKKVSPVEASIFYDDFDRIRNDWEMRWYDPTLKGRDEVIDTSGDPLFVDMHQKLLREKLDRLEKFMKH